MRDTDTDTDIPADKIDLYLRVSALAEKGAPGERDQAARTLAKMRIRYPGIEFLAEERIAAEKRANRRTGGGEPRKPAGTPKEAFWSAYTRTFESVTKILADIDRMLGDVGETQEAIGAIDETLEVSCVTIRRKGTEKFRLLVDIDSDVLQDAIEILDEPRGLRTLADHIGRRISDSLVTAFAGEDDDEIDDDDDEIDDDDDE